MTEHPRPAPLTNARGNLIIVGTGYVADLYMHSLKAFPGIRVMAAYDRDPQRLKAYCSHWGVKAESTLQALLSETDDKTIVLNLTNPASHYEVSKACLDAGRSVYSEKPLAMSMDHATDLHALASKNRLHICSAPCSILSRSAQTLWKAVREQVAGYPYLVYAELDDDLIPQAPHQQWTSSSGAPWPYEDEIKVGCTLEHAGYYLTWLIAIFGPVRSVVAAAASLIPNKLPESDCTTPDYTCATLFFDSGTVARLTCTIIAPHDHRLRLFGERGVLSVNDCWANDAPVRFRRRMAVRKRLLYSPFSRKIRPPRLGLPKPTRRGAASMNFMLGAAEMLQALEENRNPRLSGDFALHLNEVSLAIQNPQQSGAPTPMTTSCDPMEPLTELG